MSKDGNLLGSSLRGVLQRMDHGGRFARARVTSVWPQVAGEQVSSHTTGAFLDDDGSLTVYVDSPIWATELSAMAEDFRKALNGEMGEQLVRSIRFTVSRRVVKAREDEREVQETRAAYEADPSVPIPLSAAERAQVEASAAVIPDEKLREAVIRATVKDLEWKRGLEVLSARDKTS